MKDNAILIGIAGNGTVGKNTFSTLLSDRLIGFKYTEYSFAHALKSDLQPFFQDRLGLDIFNLKPQDKTEFRPVMIRYGQRMREIDPEYWVKSVNNDIIKDDKSDIISLVDVRFTNELSWLKSKNGILVYIDRYYNSHLNKMYVPPASEDEKRLNPILKKHSDYRVSWATQIQDGNKANLGGYVDDFILWMKEGGKI